MSLLPGTGARTLTSAWGEGTSPHTFASRVRPGDPAWPSDASWDQLRHQTGGRLVRVQSPLKACDDEPYGAACSEVFRELKNPYYIGDQVALTQTTGWVDAWTSQPSVYAIAAQTTDDVVAGVNFAREHNLRLVVKGGAHSYLGTSNARDSLLIWTRAMNGIALHDAFIAQGCERRQEAQPAVTVGPGAIWIHTYAEVTTNGGRYVQGGGCCTVGVAGLVLGGGFGSYSKAYGTAAASLLEAEVVTADGIVRTTNACTNPDLFWALKGGGGGSFGVVTRMTLRTHNLPSYFGIVALTVQAASDDAFRRLVGQFVSFYASGLFNPHWGEIVNVEPGRKLDIHLEFQGIDEEQARAVWQPFLGWVADQGRDCMLLREPIIGHIPASQRWDPAVLRQRAPGAILSDDRPGAPEGNVFWLGNLAEAGHFIHGYESAWLPAALLQSEQQQRLTEALVAAARHSKVEIHFQKGLAGAAEDARVATRDTSMNPSVLDAFALAIVGSEGPPAYPGIPGHEPDLSVARRNAKRVASAMAGLKTVATGSGTYVAESNFFEAEWQASYWGPNYPRLLDIKAKYDPLGLFFVHHGVGSEAWSPDGFMRLA